MIIVPASCMLSGGRILRHLASFGSDPRNAILLSGFLAGGTRGAVLAGASLPEARSGQASPQLTLSCGQVALSHEREA